MKIIVISLMARDEQHGPFAVLEIAIEFFEKIQDIASEKGVILSATESCHFYIFAKRYF